MSDNLIGVYLYPPTSLFIRPKSREDAERCMEFNYANKKLIISRDGYIGLQTEDADKGYHYLNTLIGSIGLILNPNYIVAGFSDFKPSQYLPAEKRVIMGGLPCSDRGVIKYGSELWEIFNPQPFIDIFRIRIAIELAEKMLLTDIDKYYLPYNRGYNYWYSRELVSAYVFFWFSIELSLKADWDFMVDLPKYRPNGRRLKSSHAYSIINYLYLSGRIDKQKHEDYHKARKIRNNITHEGYTPTEPETQKCGDLAYEYLFKISKMKGCNITKYKKQVFAIEAMEDYKYFSESNEYIINMRKA